MAARIAHGECAGCSRRGDGATGNRAVVQEIDALKSEADALIFKSVKVASVPVNGVPSVGTGAASTALTVP